MSWKQTEIRNALACNVQGFAMLGNLKNVRPEPKANWKTDVEDNNKKPNWNSSARTKAI